MSGITTFAVTSEIFSTPRKPHIVTQVENWRSRPTCVEALKGKAITRVAAGNGFSVLHHSYHFDYGDYKLKDHDDIEDTW